MIPGRLYSAAGQPPLPIFEVTITLLRLGTTAEVSLLLDTGTVSTLIHPRAAVLLVPPAVQLSHVVPVSGISGRGMYALEAAEMVFTDHRDQPVGVRLPLPIAQSGHANDDAPSVLGREVLSRFRLVMDIPANELYLE